MYIGNDLQIANPSYKVIDDISSSFNGSATSFALNVKGVTPVPFPINEQQVMISVNGVIQEPDATGSAGFKLLGSNIVFSSAPANGNAFFGVILAGADYVTAGSEFPDGTVTAPSFTFESDLDSGFFRSGSGAVGYSANGVQKALFDGNGLTVTGTCTATAFSGNGANLTNISASSVGTLASLTVTGDVTVDTNTFKVDATNNRVGIGTTSPTALVHCSSTGKDPDNGALDPVNYPLVVVNPEDTNGDSTGIGFGVTTSTAKLGAAIHHVREAGGSQGDLRFLTNGDGNTISERMRIDSSGRVGIGASNNTSYDSNAQNLLLANESGNYGITIRSGGGDPYAMIHFADGTTDASEKRAGRIFYHHAQNKLTFSTANTEALNLDSSQNATFAGPIGTGGAPGSYQLQVTKASGNEIARFTGANGAYLTLRNATSHEMLLYVPSGDSLKFATNGFANVALTLDANQNATFAGTVSDSIGDLRKIPNNATTSAYTLSSSDVGKAVTNTSGGVTIPNGVFTGASAVTIINHSGSDITITQASGLTLHNAADATTGNRTLAARGMATVWFQASSVAYISGAGLS